MSEGAIKAEKLGLKRRGMVRAAEARPDVVWVDPTRAEGRWKNPGVTIQKSLFTPSLFSCVFLQTPQNKTHAFTRCSN